jgi:galactosamine-6-phosphate isomerase
MQVKVVDSYQSLSEYAAEEMLQLLQEKPAAVICLASGDSPKLTCELFCRNVKETGIDTSRFFFAGLDEWVGLPPDTPGSCYHDFITRLIHPLGLSPVQYHMFNAVSDDLQAECKKMDRLLTEKGGIDLMIVGIGMNGHIGFNEPGVDFNLLSHVAVLDETTITVGQKYFQQVMQLERGITLGLKHFMNSKQVMMLANGERKSAVIKKAVEGEVTNQFPASIIQQHSNGIVLIDEAAGALLKK